ncbi:hypothetical protein M409DRAFT_21055 [Zasmidium cellare ATCC 36951]|uniref:C2 domain-containing protein n=1 Tax=Zasmidium cellare ATCC 36951 TaxID=1080233 RepID=A0A6A6CU93_ZASCE|nr:uncharacterized protein M409DRAFT_21055 [Zasmidium cellare ATCC 36951]KAF2169046.1 hypothetical protein M409DRAFT_21055 [Zasmidium cellare ATCC 36951]
MSGHEDADEAQRRYKAPYSKNHTIPTIAKYREEKQARKAEAVNEGDGADLEQSRTERAREGWRSYWAGDDKKEESGEHKQQDGGANQNGVDVDGDGDVDQEDEDEAAAAVDTSEATPIADPRKRRKGKEERAEREVTDPITHLPVKIYDFTTDALKEVEENPPPFGSTVRTSTGLSNKNKSGRDLHNEVQEMQNGQDSMMAQFPPPNFDVIRRDLISINKIGITVGLIGSVIITTLAVVVERILHPELLARLLHIKKDSSWLFRLGTWPLIAVASVAGIWFLIAGVREWMANRIDDTWESEVWEANLQSKKLQAKAHETESVSWLNSLLSSVWPLVNPDLFTSLADTLEDVMQASLPSLVQMVSCEDIGQGSESLRILGIRWLPTGAAARSVGADGKLESVEDSKKSNSDRKVAGEGEVDENAGESQENGEKGDKDEKNKSEDGTEKAAVAEGMEAEEGDFINLEVAFAYRARKSESFKERTKDMHMYLAFWLPGKIKIPVWVDVKGIVGIVRLRLQLAPDPPFFQLMTMTFLGQPKVDIKCIPIVKRGLNIMDLPLISNFVQSSVDAAMAEYVAPKSLTLDLKDMLAGDDFKKDTAARGVVVVDIKHGYDFKMGDASIPLVSDGSSDPYVSVGWAKFGKPVFSTRVLISEMEPYWHERAVLLVTPEELNVDERLRLQLWDSDRFTADDDLGRIEVDLKQIMRAEETNGRMNDRTDGFRALKAGENMPGKLEWSVGYFSKTRLQPCQFESQSFDKSIRSRDDLEKKVQETCQRKLREAMIKKGRHAKSEEELEQQKEQERKTLEDAIVISAPPPEGYPSGIFSIQIHQIVGLELEKQSKSQVDKYENHEEEAEDDDDLPSAFCTVIINHKKVFKTRTKPKNSKPFYNAGTEKFVKDWRNTEVYVSARDARVDENDALLGIVHLPLGDIFKERAQINGYYPLMGGVGHGRIRISMVWRSVQLQAPAEALGWDYGTIEVKPSITASNLPSDLQGLKMKFHTNLATGKMYPQQNSQEWKTRKDRSLHLPLHRRYATNLAIRFKRHGMLKDKTAAFAILWLKDLPDEEEREITLSVIKGNYDRARANCLSDEDAGEKVGTITIKAVFWSGLGARHQKWASKDPDMANVMEVLDVAKDNYESMKKEAELGIVDGDEDDDSSDDDDSDNSSDDDDDGEDVDGAAGNNKTNIIDKARDYKKDAKQKHRKHRGVMQYKPARNLDWVAQKAGRVEAKFEGIFRRHTREPGVETEV